MLPDRRQFLAAITTVGYSGTLLPGTLYTLLTQGADLTAETIACAEEISGLRFTDEQREQLVEDLNERLEDYAALRALAIPNEVPPALTFDPRISGTYPVANGEPPGDQMSWQPTPIARPTDDESLAFLTVAELAYLLKTREVTSTRLTRLYLDRLRRYDSVLHAVVTYTDELALEQAAPADEELDAGRWMGPLHGVPYGAKDLFAVRDYPTTWGAMPYRDQVIDTNAAVVEKLEAAGAVLVAKLSLGALAWGDVWFGGKTRNPWNIEQGSSGSSAGPAAAVAAGLVGFAMGSETLGSIVSPSNRNGVTGYRPTFGLVSRYGAMTLSWSMDKVGPMARSAFDCALVMNAIRGVDPRDPASVDASFTFDEASDVSRLRVGFLEGAFVGEAYSNQSADAGSLDVLRDLGIELRPMRLPDDLPVGAIGMTLDIEAATAFDDLTRSGRTDEMVRQGPNTWPHSFRQARFTPAVEFLQANRARTLLIHRMADVMRDVDVFVSPTFGGDTLLITNLTGHPCVCVPNAFHPVEGADPESPRRQPGSIMFVGSLYRDAEMLALAHAYQKATDFHRRRPPVE